MSLKHFKEDTFAAEVVNADTPAIVDFTATWCGPCKQLAPIVEELASQYDGSVNIGKLDIDENPGVAAQFGIRSVPTLLFFRGGEVVEKVQGVMLKDDLEKKLKAAFSMA